MNNGRRCKNCEQFKEYHYTLNYICDIDKLPLQWQEMYYSGKDISPMHYESMDNLEFLEWLVKNK